MHDFQNSKFIDVKNFLGYDLMFGVLLHSPIVVACFELFC